MHVFKIILAILILPLLVWGYFFLSFSNHLNNVTPKDIGYADAIIVLTGGANRIDTGLDLLADNKAAQLYISGAHPSVKRKDLMVMWDNPNKDICCVFLDHSAHNTYTNAQKSAKWIKDRNVKSIILVTSTYHIPRALIEFHRVLDSDIAISVYPVKSEKSIVYHAYEFNKYLIVKAFSWLF